MKILITGAAGRISYSLLPMMGLGLAFGEQQKMNLVLFDIPEKRKYLEGLQMELLDSNFQVFDTVHVSTNPKDAFFDIDVAIFLGSFPRTEGMARVDLLRKNKQIFKEQAYYLNDYAKSDVKCLVVGNPCNTNALILAQHASRIDPKNISCLMRLDQNRTVNLLSDHLSIPASDVKNVIVFGNHSNTQIPCIDFAVKSDGKKIKSLVSENWIVDTLVVRERGAEIIESSGFSSALSAAKAICDHLRDWKIGTNNGEILTMGVMSNGCYNIPNDVIFGLPVRCMGNFQYHIVDNLNISSQTEKLMEESLSELLEEKRLSEHL